MRVLFRLGAPAAPRGHCHLEVEVRRPAPFLGILFSGQVATSWCERKAEWKKTSFCLHREKANAGEEILQFHFGEDVVWVHEGIRVGMGTG